METKRTFTKDELIETYGLPGDEDNGCKIVRDKIIDQRRWSTVHELIFRLDGMEDGTAWRVTYSVGSTEQQYERPWEYTDKIEAGLVREVEKTVKVWEAVK